MFDTMTITKAVAALCGALLVFLMGSWLAETLYHKGGHGKHAEQAYVIPTDDGEAAEEEVVEEVPFADLYAAADPAEGEGLFRACAACHKLEAGANGTGPYLHGIVNRPKHSAQGYSYSSAMMEQAGEWTPENLDAFLEDPKGYTPGTAMSYNGMRDPEDRANLIAYLATFGG